MLLIAGIALMSLAAISMIWLSGLHHASDESRAISKRDAVRNLITQKRFLEVALSDSKRALNDVIAKLDATVQQLVIERRRVAAAQDQLRADDSDNSLFELAVPSDIFSIYSGDIPTPIPMARRDEDTFFALEPVDPIRAMVGHFSHRAFAQVGLGVLVADSDGKVAYLNPVLALMTGWSAERAMHQSVDDVLRTTRTPVPSVGALPRLEQLGEEDDTAPYMQLVLHHRAGHRLEIKRAAFAVRDQAGRRIGRVVLVRDKSESRLMTLNNASQIQTDVITGLLNRQSFNSYLERAVEERRLDEPKVFLFLDIDHFRVVNDTCGFEAGDALLQWVAAALRESVREHDVVARLGGDEFGVLLSSATASDAQKMAREVQRRLKAFSFSWVDKTIDVTLSVALLPLTENFSGLDKLLGVASQLCGIAKDNGGNQILAYRTDDIEVERRRTDMMHAASVKGNLREGRFLLWAQPIQALSPVHQGGLRFEVLLRCLDANDQPLSPVDVIRAAERYGGMLRLDRWVIKKTLETLASRPDVLDKVELCSINLSGASLKNGSILEFVHDQFRFHGVPPSKICFELTETAAVENLCRALRVIDGLCALGCQFALDDFGSGLASYGYIKDLPISQIKIDGGFVRDMGKNTLNRAIVESINMIGHFLGIKTTAEAVGCRQVFEELQILGVDYAQGYWVGKPAPLADILGVPVLGSDRPSVVPAPLAGELETPFDTVPTTKLRPIFPLGPQN
ncbi:MAG: EAL domain-containing protein [Myxococcota bacterium]|jgi:diguanylate cyclase (GGDEF)-like protein/PAS domain S-box-containing protein|nr:EAL domain-containing protein [Myxococcota bacterium]